MTGFAVAVLLGIVGCSAEDDTGSPPPAPTSPARPTTTTDAPPPAAGDTGVLPDLSEVTVRLTTVGTADSPTAMVQRPGTGTFLIAERGGTIRAATPVAGRLEIADEPLLDLASDVGGLDGERGLLGLAVTPDDRRLVVSYTDGDDDGASVLAIYDLLDETIDVSSRVEVLRLPQPFANHNGGHVTFGPDGYLYAGFGDGGSQGDPDRRGQDLTTLLGKVLRIDVSGSSAEAPYTVPADNPFVATDGARNEVWAFGVRNPWRFAFDEATGDLWVADVGGSEWEEVDHLPAATGAGRGANLGWSLREGAHDTDQSGPRPSDLVEPIVEYSHDEGASITGGVVYRGTALPDLVGAYLYSDFAAATLRAVRPGADGPDAATLSTTGAELSQVVSFASDGAGEVYVVCLTGEILRIDPA